MPQPHPGRDYWRLPTLMLWIVFLAVGVAPEAAYHEIRAAGCVLPQDALTNSAFAISLAFSLYVGVFFYIKCRQIGVSESLARACAVQNAVIALVAFFPFRLGLLVQAHNVPYAAGRRLLYAFGTAKLLALWYLLTVMVCHYAFGSRRIFSLMVSLFPSTYRRPCSTEGEDTPHDSDAAPREEAKPEPPATVL